MIIDNEHEIMISMMLWFDYDYDNFNIDVREYKIEI